MNGCVFFLMVFPSLEKMVDFYDSIAEWGAGFSGTEFFQ